MIFVFLFSASIDYTTFIVQVTEATNNANGEVIFFSLFHLGLNKWTVFVSTARF